MVFAGRIINLANRRRECRKTWVTSCPEPSAASAAAAADAAPGAPDVSSAVPSSPAPVEEEMSDVE